jgi:hypothetical protein
MNTGSKSFWPLVAAVGVGVSVVGYCMYFDRKRRSAPDFSEKLKASKYLMFFNRKIPDEKISSQAEFTKSVFNYLERKKQKPRGGVTHSGDVRDSFFEIEFNSQINIRLTQAIPMKCVDFFLNKFNKVKIVYLVVGICLF